MASTGLQAVQQSRVASSAHDRWHFVRYVRAKGPRWTIRVAGSPVGLPEITCFLLEMVRAGAAASSAGYGDDVQIQAAQWIESVTGQPLEGEDFADSLRDGVKLCDLINTIKPGAVKRVNRKEGQNKFKQMENISNFIRACRELGVKEYSLFETVDLYEGKDVGLVVKCLVRKRK